MPNWCTSSRWKTLMATSNLLQKKIPSANRSAIKSQRADIPLKNKNPELKNPFVIPGIRNVKIESQLNPIYTFENFLEGDSNRLAVKCRNWL